jgi:hypothetical protein
VSLAGDPLGCLPSRTESLEQLAIVDSPPPSRPRHDLGLFFDREICSNVLTAFVLTFVLFQAVLTPQLHPDHLFGSVIVSNTLVLLCDDGCAQLRLRYH